MVTDAKKDIKFPKILIPEDNRGLPSGCNFCPFGVQKASIYRGFPHLVGANQVLKYIL
jgi:hypothetical protein